MSIENVELIKRIYQGFAQRALDAIPEYFDPEVNIYQSELLPWGGHYHGHQGAFSFFSKLTLAIDSQVTIGQLIDAGEHVIEIGHTRGKVLQTGIEFDVPEVHVWRVRAGRVLAFEAYIDIPSMAAALSRQETRPSSMTKM